MATDITEAFVAMADAFENHFGLTLEAVSTEENSVVVKDSGDSRGVDKIGTARNLWLIRNAAKFGFDYVGKRLPQPVGGYLELIETPVIAVEEDAPVGVAPIEAEDVEVEVENDGFDD